MTAALLLVCFLRVGSADHLLPRRRRTRKRICPQSVPTTKWLCPVMVYLHRSHGSGSQGEPATFSACLARLLCAAAVAIALWVPQRAGQPFATSRDLAAGIVGLIIAAVLLLLPARACVRDSFWTWDGINTNSEVWDADMKSQAAMPPQSMAQWLVWAGSPGLLLLAALAAMTLTGGWDSPLALLLLLPALVLDTSAGERGVLVLASAILLAALCAGLIANAPTVIRGQSMVDLAAPGIWAAAGALVYWLRVLLAERQTIVQQAHVAAQALRQEAEAMNRSQRDLVAHVSHELLTPLAAIQVGAGMLGEPLESCDPSGTILADSPTALEADLPRRIGRNIQRNTLRLTLLVNDLLELARIDEDHASLHPARHGCALALRNATEAVAVLLAGQDQRAEWSTTPTELTYWGDARRVDQVLVNLLANAHKYAGTGATITLRARVWAGGVRWEVSDDGPQLGDQTLLHLFERYYRAPEVTISGNGLGLSIAKILVELHGGRIWAENNSGPGCRFIFWLPDSGGDEALIAGHDTAQEGAQQ